MGSRIGVGIVGCGFGAYHHGKTLAAEYDDRFKLIGFCDVNRQRLEQTCSSFNVRGYSDIDEMLADRNVELVIIATRPHTTHFPLAVKSLKAGRNVVVEKPMCITSGEAREMIKVRDETRRLLTVHQNRRWDMDYLDIRQVLERGTLGEVRCIRSCYLGGFGEVDCLYDMGSHLIDQILRLAGGLPAKVLGTLAYPDNEWNRQGFFSAGMLYGSGLIAEVSAVPQGESFIIPRFYLLGTKGIIIHDWVQRCEDAMLKHMTFASADKGIEFDFFRPEYYSSPAWKIPSYYDNLYDAVNGRGEVAVKPEESMETIIVIEAVIRSAREKCFVDIKRGDR